MLRLSPLIVSWEEGAYLMSSLHPFHYKYRGSIKFSTNKQLKYKNLKYRLFFIIAGLCSDNWAPFWTTNFTWLFGTLRGYKNNNILLLFRKKYTHIIERTKKLLGKGEHFIEFCLNFQVALSKL